MRHRKKEHRGSKRKITNRQEIMTEKINFTAGLDKTRQENSRLFFIMYQKGDRLYEEAQVKNAQVKNS